ncbi:MAG: sulfatase [Lactobacillus sp.]|nr:sulfatase [Lactobacillus sp.]
MKILNIIYIHTHDTGRLVSAYGYGVPTPEYQAFCQDAILFQNAFSVAPTCSPSRASLLTGVYPHQNGMLGLAQRGFKLDKRLHLARYLRDHGYETALCGVQHEIGYYTDHALAVDNLGYQRDLTTDSSQYDEEHLVEWDNHNADKLANWFDERTDTQPFFVSFGMHATHRQYPQTIAKDIAVSSARPPLNVANDPETRQDFAAFETSAEYADHNLKVVLDALKRNGLYEKTIIVLTTDHGVAFPFAKCTLTDSGIGVLMAIRVPGCVPAEYNGLLSQIDVIPTLLDLVNLEKPNYLEGKSFAPIFDGNEYKGDDYVFGEVNFHTSYEPIRSVRSKRYKYIRYFDDYEHLNLSNIDNSPTKTFYAQEGLREVTKPKEALYDLYYDVMETNNLLDDPRYLAQLTNMRQRLSDFMVRTEDPLLNGPIPIQSSWKVNKREAYSAHAKDKSEYENLPE